MERTFHPVVGFVVVYFKIILFAIRYGGSKGDVEVDLRTTKITPLDPERGRRRKA